MKKGSMGNVLFYGAFVLLSCVYASKGPDWIWFLDDLLHTMGGMIICSFTLWDSRNVDMSWWMRGVLCAGVVATAGIAWEEFRYYFREVTTGHPENYITLDDTMTDLVYDLCGGYLRWMYFMVAQHGKD